MMKPLILTLALLLCVVTLSAQYVKVNVISQGAPLEYANLFINSKYYGYSDSTGVVGIRRSDISVGDTISVSFVGMDGGRVVYIPDNYRPEGIMITLTPNLVFDTVVIYTKDKSEQLLRRYVKDRVAIFWFAEYRADYRIDWQNDKGTAGSFLYTNFPQKYADYYKLEYLKITPASDTTRMSASIGSVIRTAINASILSVQLKNRYASAKGMKVRYMGKDNGRHVFLLIMPVLSNMVGKEEGFQAIIFADEKSREIVFTETTILLSDGRIVELSAGYTIRDVKYVGTMIHPTRIDGSISVENGKTYFSIEDIAVTRYDGPPIPRKDR